MKRINIKNSPGSLIDSIPNDISFLGSGHKFH